MVETSPNTNSDPQFDLQEAFSQMQDEQVVQKCAKFLDISTPMQVRVTTSQQVANMNDHRNVALVFDMRSQKAFSECHLEKSLNLPMEKFSEDFFINWSKSVKVLENDTSILTDKYKQDSFVKRKRHWVYIIAGNSTSFIHR